MWRCAEFFSVYLLHPSLAFILIIISLHYYSLSRGSCSKVDYEFLLTSYAWLNWRNWAPSHDGSATNISPHLWGVPVPCNLASHLLAWRFHLILYFCSGSCLISSRLKNLYKSVFFSVFQSVTSRVTSRCSLITTQQCFFYHAANNPPAMWETWVQSLGWEDPLEESMASHSRILSWRIPMDRGNLWATWGHKESNTTEWLSTAQKNCLKFLKCWFLF